MPLDQLCLSPQCGFASTVEGNALTDDEQWAKLARVVETADSIWGAPLRPGGLAGQRANRGNTRRALVS